MPKKNYFSDFCGGQILYRVQIDTFEHDRNYFCMFLVKSNLVKQFCIGKKKNIHLPLQGSEHL